MIKLDLDPIWYPFLKPLKFVAIFIGFWIMIHISELLRPDDTLKQSLFAIRFLLACILIVLIMLFFYYESNYSYF